MVKTNKRAIKEQSGKTAKIWSIPSGFMKTTSVVVPCPHTIQNRHQRTLGLHPEHGYNTQAKTVVICQHLICQSHVIPLILDVPPSSIHLLSHFIQCHFCNLSRSGWI